MTAAFELGGKERGHAGARHLGPDQAGAQRDRVGVVMAAAQPGRERLGDLRAAHLGMAVGGDGDADPRTAQRDPPLGRTRRDRLGPHGPDSVDYPDYGYKLAEAIASGAAERGIALCGSGIGIAIAINRNSKVRCAQVSEPLSARLCRSHNDANAIAMGARLIGPEMARACAKAFLETEFEGGRHCGRVDKLSKTPQDA